MSDEIDELTRVKAIIDGLSSPTDREFVYATDQFSAQAIGSAAAMIAKEGGGGPGELPDWWTVDSTPGAESVEFAGMVSIAPTAPDVVLLDLQPDAASSLGINVLQWHNAAGAVVGHLDEDGGFVFASGCITGGQHGSIRFDVASDLIPGSPMFLVSDDLFSTWALNKPGGGFTSIISSHSATDELFTLSAFTGQSGRMMRVDDEDGNTCLGIGPRGYIDMLEQTEPAAPGADTGRLFMKDTGGKTQLLCRFPSGVSQVIATEP